MKLPRARTFIANAATVAISLTLVFALCEGLARLLFKDSTVLTPRYQTSAVYGDVILRRNRPNMRFTHTTRDGTWAFTTNAQGFRNDSDFDYEKPEGRLRVVVLGDSQTQGHECHQDYTYSSVTERFLRSRGLDVEVMNTGVSGFSTAEALLLLEHEMTRYSPDFVVLGFYANDFQDNLKAGFFSLDEQGQLRLQKREHIPGVRIQDLIYAVPGTRWLGENSYFYSILFNETWKFFKSRLSAAARRSIPDEMAVPTKSEFTEYETELAAALIRRMYEVSKQAGADFILLDIPTGTTNTVRPSVTDELRLAIEGDVDRFVPSAVLTRYQHAAPFHVPHGGRHITEFTHTLLGTEIAEYILARTDRDAHTLLTGQ